MDCRRYMLKFLAGMLLIGMPVLSSAIDLPIKKIDGKDYYYYNVKAKETVFGLCRNLNLTKAEIVKYNPSVADGLRAGDVLYFPVELLAANSRSSRQRIRMIIPVSVPYPSTGRLPTMSRKVRPYMAFAVITESARKT